jgi:hypothetical protein
VNEDFERSALRDENVSIETQPGEDETPQESRVVDQETVAEEKESAGTLPTAPVVETAVSSIEQVNVDSETTALLDEEDSSETEPREDEAPQEPSVLDQKAVAEEKDSNETEPNEPQEPCVIDQEAVEEVTEEASLKTVEQALLTAENIRKAEEQVATKNNSNLSFGKLCNDLLPTSLFLIIFLMVIFAL